MKRINKRYDINGKEIKVHDVCKNTTTNEIVLVVYGYNYSRVCGLAVENKLAGIEDWLDVYPSETFEILGNAETSI